MNILGTIMKILAIVSGIASGLCFASAIVMGIVLLVTEAINRLRLPIKSRALSRSYKEIKRIRRSLRLLEDYYCPYIKCEDCPFMINGECQGELVDYLLHEIIRKHFPYEYYSIKENLR